MPFWLKSEGARKRFCGSLMTALLLVAAVGALNLSLGDIVEDEANLPSSTNLINANRERRSAFIKGDKD